MNRSIIIVFLMCCFATVFSAADGKPKKQVVLNLPQGTVLPGYDSVEVNNPRSASTQVPAPIATIADDSASDEDGDESRSLEEVMAAALKTIEDEIAAEAAARKKAWEAHTFFDRLKDSQQYGEFSKPARWWQTADAVGLSPALIGDAVDLMTFTSTNPVVVGSGAVASATGRLGEMLFNGSMLNSSVPARADEKSSVALRSKSADNFGNLMHKANRFIGLPLSTMIDAGTTALSFDQLVAYNNYLQQHKNDRRVAPYLKKLRRNRLIMGGMLGVEALLNILKYQLYFSQKQSPDLLGQAETEADASRIGWSKSAGLFSAALSLARRLWWSKIKQDHLKQATELHLLKMPERSSVTDILK